ncbi:hypothetical protein CLU81_0125 [Flavobacterium sp. 9]|uniref:hypothetical protein n=1 Tax=Flavobacterium sp. 9 TaxID=2035198 RepID=UPI000C193FC8|nr:hypothetical protein [Flavobacterium sp. 9]PIF29741.1 hypothetical protein CLU81_0125 [Flavobacterium sp. 9]
METVKQQVKNDLLEFAIKGHGGQVNFNKFETVSARLICDGVLWSMVGHPGSVDDIYVTSNTNKQFTSHSPFLNEDWHTAFTAKHVAILNSKDEVLEEISNPRDSFAGYTTETPWSRLQLAYFTGYAMWTYFNAPFNFVNEGYKVKELELWEENGETFRRLQVTFPEDVATHSPVQTFYIDKEGLIKRHDYNVDIAGGATAAHYLSHYIDVQGIKIATKRNVYIRQEDNTPLFPEPLLVSIDLREISRK